jgi:hypothetical protein
MEQASGMSVEIIRSNDSSASDAPSNVRIVRKMKNTLRKRKSAATFRKEIEA